jgi:putative redox protein
MEEGMDIMLRRISGKVFEGKNSLGGTVVANADKDPEAGGVSPMEMVLVGLASCSASDVVIILEKQKEPLAAGCLGARERAEGIRRSSRYLHLLRAGEAYLCRLKKAVELSMEMYAQ